LATKWRITPTQATFTIRKGVTCSDGSALTPNVIAENLDYFKSPKVQYPALGTLDYQVASDDAAHTVTIRFKQPVSFVLQSLQYISIVCGKGLKDRSMLQRQTSGSGPYVLSQAVPNDHYTFTLRKGYAWGPDGATTAQRGMPATVVFKVVPNETTAANLLLNGQVTTSIIRGPDGRRLAGQGVPSVSKPLSITQMFFNQAPGRPAADPLVRRALTTAVDRAEVAKVVGGQVASRLLAPAMNPCLAGTAGGPIPAGGAEQAASLLDQAGWKKDSSGMREKNGKRLTIDVLGTSSAGSAVTAGTELIAQTWRHLGIDVKEQILAETPAVQALTDGGWDAFPLNSVGVTSPAQLVPFVSGAAPPKGSNWGHISNRTYGTRVTKASATDPAAACSAWNAAERALVNDIDVVPMVVIPTTWFVTKQAGFSVSSLGVIPTSIRMHQG
jgi:peptide/nickel transport system substrate-binding protein